MSISSSLYSGISGLSTNATAMTVIGNNIANANTTGFKTGRANFADAISQSIASGANLSQVGRGSQVSGVVSAFTQGSLESTQSVTDLAIEGEGFFIVNDGLTSYYTRAGAFNFDKNGNLTNPEGMTVQGWDTDTSGNPVGATKDINFAASSATPNASTTATVNLNLDSGATVFTAAPPVFDPATPDTTSNFASGMTLYDSLGNSHTATVYYTKRTPVGLDPHEWEWNVVVGAGDHASGVDTVCAGGVMTFTANGELSTETQTTNDFDFAGGPAQSQSIAFDFGDELAVAGNTGLAGSTQFGADFAVTVINQDGYSSGALQSLSVDNDGLITGFFTNGQTKPLSLIAVANFQNLNGLSKEGGNLFAETFHSGQPVVSQAGAGGAGVIQSNSLEQSNVDLAQEFVRMITTQRGFQANSRTISVTDEMMAEIINIKR